jgi:hypothetical protein
LDRQRILQSRLPPASVDAVKSRAKEAPTSKACGGTGGQYVVSLDFPVNIRYVKYPKARLV